MRSSGEEPPATPHLVLGGARSGKSTYAERLLTAFPGPYLYLATAQALDEEMLQRIDAHRERRGSDWETLESPIELVSTLHRCFGQDKPVLVDCLTLWLSNLLLSNRAVDPKEEVEALARLLERADFPLILVSNEVGGGIVPDNPLARQFRDLAGFANQRVAAVCPSVTVVFAGLPLRLK